MKAIVYHQYGSPDVLQLADVAVPVPADDEVLIRVHASSINAADWRFLRADPFLIRFDAGLLKPKNPILGVDVAGVVDAVGSAVTHFKVGDRVFGDISGCGLGGFAQFATAKASVLAIIPDGVTFVQAGAAPVAGLTALQGLRDKAQVRPGQQVMVRGASGGVGSFAVQVAKALGAEVTGVASSTKLDMLAALGADHRVDYHTQNGDAQRGRYDIIFDAAGFDAAKTYLPMLKPDGRYIWAGGAIRRLFQAMALGVTNKRVTTLTVKVSADDLATLGDMIAAGTVVPHIDRCYPLADVPAAIRYLEDRHVRGKVGITID